MRPADAKLVRELKEIARQDGWTAQRIKSMLGILRSTPEQNRAELLKIIRDRRPKA